MKNIGCFFLIAIVVGAIRLVATLVIALLITWIDKLGIPLLSVLEYVVYAVPVILCAAACFKIADGLNCYKPLKVFCIISLVLNIIFAIENIRNGDTALPNIYMILLFDISGIVECKKNI